MTKARLALALLPLHNFFEQPTHSNLKTKTTATMSEEAENEQLTIRIKDGNGEETQFKIKKTTKMGKVFKAYAERKGISQSTLRFLLDGERVNDDQTAKMLELEDGDQIDAVLEQVGGSA